MVRAVRVPQACRAALAMTAIGAALADGTVKKLADKWFKTDVTP